MVFNELILKVSSCCNLNCKYCYVFNQGDNSYKNEPAIISNSLIGPIVERIKEHCETHSVNTFLVIFNAGEPLLVPKEFFSQFINLITKSVPDTKFYFGLQTNGTLLTQELFSYLDSLNISIGISLDGTEKASQNRVYRSNNKCAYPEILRGIKILQKNNIAVNILSVINIEEEPERIYEHLKFNDIASVDFLFPDIIYKVSTSNEVGKWLIKLFDLWYDDEDVNKPLIRYFDTIVGLFMGVERGYEVLGRKINTTISIKPNGNIELVDNLKVCGDGFTHTGLNVLRNSFDDVSDNEIMKKYYDSHQDSVLCKKCRECLIRNICGGGNLAHRYSPENGFDNPSAYCKDIYSLVSHIQHRLISDLPDIFNNSNILVIE